MIDVDNPVIEFTAEDRCDRCGAQALVLATHEDFGELTFCWHHGGYKSPHRQTLLDEGWTLIDNNEEYESYMPNNHTPVL